MFWSAQRLVSRPTRKARPTTPRRPLLQVDALEDRFAPATLVLLGQPAEVVVSSVSIVNFSAPQPTVLTSVNAPVSSATVGSFATFDEIPFGFFHPFAQAGVIGEQNTFNEPPLAAPLAVQPPAPGATNTVPALPAGLPSLPAPQIEALPAVLPAPAAPPAAIPALPALPAAPVEMKLSPFELSRLNDVEPATVDSVWGELLSPSTGIDPFEVASDDAPESPTLGAALAAIGLLSLRPTGTRRDRDLALAFDA